MLSQKKNHSLWCRDSAGGGGGGLKALPGPAVCVYVKFVSCVSVVFVRYFIRFVLSHVRMESPGRLADALPKLMGDLNKN